MRPLLLLIPLIMILSEMPISAQSLPEDRTSVELIGHSWQLEEEWPKIHKTKYSWRAKVRNNTSHQRKVSVYYTLLNEAGAPLARNTTSQVIAPHQTLEITSDSYVENRIIPYITTSRAVIKFH
ncbi:MAG: hypothetical protein V3U07_05305 [Nitrospirales bacterium]